jgi:PGF-CTERM protein
MRNLVQVILALATVLVPSALAANPVDTIAAPFQQNLNITAQDLEKKALEHIVQGNLTQEHLSQDLNATKDQLRMKAQEQINQGLNVTPEQLAKRAKDELKNQLNQKAQLPGFEALIGLIGLGAALALRRWN